MSEGPLFSVILSTYDRPGFLMEALESIRIQTIDDWECIVVDDASPAPVSFPSESRFRVVRRSSNGGCGAARNTGVLEASGRFLVFLDDDDLFTPDRLEMALEGLSRAPVALCWTRFLDGPTRPNRRLDGWVEGRLHEGLVPTLGATAVLREAFLPFDERFRSAEDVEWWIRVARRHPVATVPRFGHLFRRHAGTRHGNGLVIRSAENIRLMELHRDYFTTYPRARAFRWTRVGLLALQIGNNSLGRRAFLRSFRIRPRAATGWHLLRSLIPSKASRSIPEEVAAS